MLRNAYSCLSGVPAVPLPPYHFLYLNGLLRKKPLYDISDDSALPPLLEKSYNFRRRSLMIGNLRYHFVQEGNPHNPAVLMLHGNPTWSFYFRRLIAALSETHYVIAPDHMGCGLSDKPRDYPYRLKNHMDNVEKLVDHLGLKRITLVCHDWGGAVGMGIAARRPELFSRFVVFNTGAWRSTRMPKRIAVCRIPILGALAVRGLNGFALAATRMAVAKPLGKGAKAGLLYPYDSWKNRIAILRFVQDIPMNPSHPSHGCLRETERHLHRLRKKPMMICWGMKDWCFDSVFLSQWRERFPGASVTEFPNAGHYILEDAHETVIPAVRNFLTAKNL